MSGAPGECFVQTAVQLEGFEDTYLPVAQGADPLQLEVRYRFKPEGLDAEAAANLRQDSEQLVRQCANYDPEMAALVGQALAPFQAGAQGLPEWGGLMLSQFRRPFVLHRCLVREGHNLVAILRAVLSEKAVVNKLSASRRSVSAPSRLDVPQEAAQRLIRASPDQLRQEQERIGAAIPLLDRSINALAAGHDVLLPSTLWQALSRQFDQARGDGENLISQVLLLQILCGLVTTLVQNPAWQARMAP
ncbi:MAG: hypothetical protein LC623_05005 [Halobacteriales archaeon]|nr:hypothetical protein [Halobacteriales archaeon]